ncbi:transposase domain-containing protein [Streptomyces sp. DvalAA-43]|uniref:transposase domain-containing protein n=1 Tax=Streptomyces sp. DvalAA-43 TaxID=1839762 RepID=UPI000B855F98|nr:hypothetical protein [Streptomyces sp. SID4936]
MFIFINPSVAGAISKFRSATPEAAKSTGPLVDEGVPPRSSRPTERIPLSLQPAITTITRSLMVAFGLFAPGPPRRTDAVCHPQTVRAVLEETGRLQRRLRALPARVAVCFVLALVLLPELSHATWRQPTASLGPARPPRVSEAAPQHLRRRLSPASFQLLFHTVWRIGNPFRAPERESP